MQATADIFNFHSQRYVATPFSGKGGMASAGAFRKFQKLRVQIFATDLVQKGKTPVKNPGSGGAMSSRDIRTSLSNT